MLQALIHPQHASSSTESLVVPPQLQSLQTAVNFGPNSPIEVAAVSKLLTQMCHPQMSQRIRASAIAGISWLTTAVAEPLPPFPAILGFYF